MLLFFEDADRDGDPEIMAEQAASGAGASAEGTQNNIKDADRAGICYEEERTLPMTNDDGTPALDKQGKQIMDYREVPCPN